MQLPKKLLNIKFNSQLSIYFTLILLFFLLFFGIFVIQGLKIQSRMDMAKNFIGHIDLKSNNYNPNNIYDINTWWPEARATLEQQISDPYIRGITQRVYLPALYQSSSNRNSVPFELIGTTISDANVFNNLIYENPNNAFIPTNSVNIGKNLAIRLGLSEGDPFPIYIPKLGLTLSDITVNHIIPSITPFIDNYGVFISKDSIPTIYSRFTDYHIRFSATPYMPILVSNLSVFIDDSTYYTPDDKLEYQFFILNTLENILLQISNWIYLICGIILFFAHYFHRYYFEEELDLFFYRQGSLKIPTIYMELIWKTLITIVISSIIALAIALFIISLKPEIYANPFISPSGLFIEFALPLDYVFSPRIDIIGAAKILFFGIFYALLGYILMIIAIFFIKKIIVSSNKSIMVLISMLCFLIFGYITSKTYFYDISAEKGRQNFWKQAFFGESDLTEKNYLDNFFFYSPHTIFELPESLGRILDSKKYPYTAELEVYGQQIDSINFNDNYQTNIIKKNIIVKGMVGYNSVVYNDTLDKISNNQVIIGKDIAAILNNTNVITLQLKDTYGKLIDIDLRVNEIKDFGVGILNNTLFMNIDRLRNLIKTEKNKFTKIQLLSSSKILQKYTNDTIISENLNKSTKTWHILSDIILLAEYTKTITITIALLLILVLLTACVILTHKEELFFSYTWGYNLNIYQKEYWGFIILFGLGSLGALLINIIYIIYAQPLPPFLKLEQLTPDNIHFGFPILRSLLLFLSISIVGIFGNIFLKHFVLKTRKKFVLRNYNNHLS